MNDNMPFSNLTVIDLAWVVAGPAIGRTLADYGATVIRVESTRKPDTARLIGPFKDGVVDWDRSALFDTYNAGKFGITLDLKSESGKEVLIDLVKSADILIESFSPGQLEKWGLGWETLHEQNPRLILLSTSLLGQSGPFRNFAGFGNLGSALSGYQNLAGEPDRPPIGPLGPYTDYVGPRFSLIALMAAMEKRRVTGQGCWLDVSQVEAGIQFLAPEVAYAAETGVNVEACGNRDIHYAPHGVFRCDGKDNWIAIAVRTDKEWKRLADLIGGEARDSKWDLFKNRKDEEHELESLVSSWTSNKEADEIEKILQAINLPAYKVCSPEDIINDKQLEAREHFIRRPHPLGGESIFDASRYNLSLCKLNYSRVAPHPGRDNEFILKEILGYEDERIADLKQNNILS